MTPTQRRVEIWSEIHCPWALLALYRLRRARATHHLDVALVPRAWPLEWVNSRGTPRTIVQHETKVLADQEPGLLLPFSGEAWPSTFLPAFELVAAARRAQGELAAGEVDYALRLAFFRDSVDVSIEAGLIVALDLANDQWPDLDADLVIDIWRESNPRADVVADYKASQRVSIQGSPQIIWPDGTSTHNPGLTDHHWIGDTLHMGPSQPDEPERLLLACCGPKTTNLKGRNHHDAVL